MKARRLLPELVTALTLSYLLFAPSCANTTQAPTGGDKDTIPPVLLWTIPQPGATNLPVSKLKLQFGFDEYVTIKDAKGIFLSPPQAKAPKAVLSGKSVVVTFEEDLEPCTTYSLTFTSAIADNNEGNMFPGFNYVFSTGDTIDSMMVTGKVYDSESLKPVKGATVMLYRDLSDSAVMKTRPYAAVKTDDWGFFALPYIGDTVYRMYAVEDANADNLYNPSDERIAFIDSLVRPLVKVNDTLPELMYFEMTDTLNCESRKVEYTLRTFKESTSKQFIRNHGRTSDKSGFIAFASRNAWIDSLWIQGYPQEKLISQFNLEQDSLELWINDRRPAPDTLHLWVNYRKTDSLGKLEPFLEHIRLFSDKPRKTARQAAREATHEDSICVFKLEAKGETVEQNGFSLEFKYPVVFEHFDSLVFHYLTPKQKDEKGSFTVEKDSLDVKRYILRPRNRLQPGYEYFMKVPHHTFQDITGNWSDSTEVKVSLPTDEALSTLTASFKGVDRKIIVDLMDDKRSSVMRSYVLDSDKDLLFPYLKEGKYSLRITDDSNRNSIVDTGNLLEHKQPEKMVFFKLDNGNEYIEIPASSEITQEINLQDAIKD